MSEIFLKYGVNPDGELIHISQVGRGRVALGCPYCGVGLLARKGEKMAAHFAHHGPTCNQASRDPDVIALPAFDRFNLDVPGKVVEELRAWWQRPNHQYNPSNSLRQHGLIEDKSYLNRGGWQPTHKGRLILGELSLDLFNKFQEPLIAARHEELLERARVAQGTAGRVARLAEIEAEYAAIKPLDHGAWDKSRTLEAERRALQQFDNGLDFQTALTDLQLYRQQWRRILTNTLYFLEVVITPVYKLYKIGVTTRPIAERIAEITAELKPLVGDVAINVIKTFDQRGNVEPYFKYRYAARRAALDTLTEYFDFISDLPEVKRDLSRMQAKTLTPLELEIIRGDRTPVELEIEAAAIEDKRRAAIKVGIARRAAQGEAVGRPRRTSPETPQEVLSRDYAPQVIEALNQGLSLRAAAAAAGVAVNTVRKVQAAHRAQHSNGND